MILLHVLRILIFLKLWSALFSFYFMFMFIRWIWSLFLFSHVYFNLIMILILLFFWLWFWFVLNYENDEILFLLCCSYFDLFSVESCSSSWWYLFWLMILLHVLRMLIFLKLWSGMIWSVNHDLVLVLYQIWFDLRCCCMLFLYRFI